MATTSTKRLALELTELGASSQLVESERGRRALQDALGSHNAQLTIQAARLLAEHKPGGFEPPLRAAYRALTGERASSLDPGCLAKQALIDALDALDDSDADLFAEASQYVQLDRMKGGPRDTAAGVRARGVLGLARLGHSDFLPIVGACLGDRDASVRLSAARSVAHRGQRDGAGLLLLRLAAGDDTPEVLSECLRGLIALAPDLGLRHARARLGNPDDPQREQTLHALGTAPSDAAVELLREELESRALAEERQPIIEALGLSLRPRARAILLELVGGDRASDAEAALSALAIHRYDDKLAAQLRELSQHSRELSRRVVALFPR